MHYILPNLAIHNGKLLFSSRSPKTKLQSVVTETSIFFVSKTTIFVNIKSVVGYAENIFIINAYCSCITDSELKYLKFQIMSKRVVILRKLFSAINHFHLYKDCISATKVLKS